jgi:hypothetical protein
MHYNNPLELLPVSVVVRVRQAEHVLFRSLQRTRVEMQEDLRLVRRFKTSTVGDMIYLLVEEIIVLHICSFH